MFSKKISRRKMIKLMANGATAILFSDLLSACGGGGNNPTTNNNDNTISTKSISGSIDISHIGGTNLTICSATADATLISADGAFSILIPINGIQLQFVTDDTDRIWALSFSNPSDSSPLLIDAKSTALSLLMITPGILTISPSDAPQILSDLELLNSFPELENYLQSNLIDNSLDDLISQDTLPILIRACIDEWIEKYYSFDNSKKRQSKSPTIMGSTENETFEAVFKSSSSVSLSNYSWRFVQVAREYLDVNHNVISTAMNANTLAECIVYNAGSGIMDGPEPFTMKSIFMDILENKPIIKPCTDIDSNIDFSNPESIAFIKYYIYGIGFADVLSDNTVTFPVETSWTPIIASITYYIVFEIISGLYSIKFSISEVKKILEAIFKFGKEFVKALADLSRATDSDSIMDSCFKICKSVIKLIYNLAVAEFGESKLTSRLAATTKLFDKIFAVAHISIALRDWTILPKVDTLLLPINSINVTIE